MRLSFLFPSARREFKGRRRVRIGVRTAHLIAIAFPTGGVAQGHAPLELQAAF